MSEPWERDGWVAHTRVMLDSYRRWLGRDLVPRTGTPEDQAKAMFDAPFVVVSHGTQADPLLSYGNRIALELWAMDADTLVRTPSRLTAEPGERAERAELMDRTARDGHATGYTGIRVSATGRRFRIAGAVVWNLLDADGQLAGQAATFSEWAFLGEARTP